VATVQHTPEGERPTGPPEGRSPATPELPPDGAPPEEGSLSLLRLVGFAVATLVVLAGFVAAFELMREEASNRLLVASVALVVGVGGVFLLFWAMDRVVDSLPARWREGARPYVFVGPAMVIVAIFLVYPVVNTIVLSFKDARSESWVGLDNYEFVFTDPSMLRSIRNSFGWIIIVPAVSVSIGLVFATLADRLRRGEALAKSMIFLPMAISFVGAAVTFRLIYSYRPTGFGENVGLLNGIWTGFGNEPVAWLDEKPWNNLMLMAIMIWMQTGFAMVVLSSAIKAIPSEIIEAARIDGASEWQIFRRITVPSILPTLVVVVTYMVINALKVFDIVFVTGNTENREIEVIAERMIRWFFINNNDGRAAAISVVLFLAIVPVMVWNVRKFREQEAMR
jgi:alpha-glucoside transport system permease protein